MVHFGTSMLSWIPSWTGEGGAYAIEKAAQCGFELLEISLPGNLDIDTSGVRSQLEHYGIGGRFSLLLPAAYHLPIHPGKALEYLKVAIEIVHKMNGHFLGGVFYGAIGVFSGHPRTENERETMEKVLREAASFAGERDITLALEPVNRYETYLVTSTSEALDLIEAVGSPGLGLMLDTFHMNIEESNFSEPLLAAGKHLHYMHLAGSDRGLPGEDHVSWDELFGALRDIGFEGDLVLESFSSGVPGMAEKTALWRPSRYPPDELASASLGFMRKKARQYGLI